MQLLTRYERSGVLPHRDLAYYDGLVRDVREAASSGEESAMRRVAGVFRVARSSFNWDHRTSKERQARLRRFVGEQLGKPGGDELQKWAPTAADARLFVARAHGYENWTQLTEEIGNRRGPTLTQLQ